MNGPCLCGDPLCRRCFPGGFEPEQEVCSAVEMLLDIGLKHHHDRNADETFTECRLCGMWEEHSETCPIPVLKRWIES